MTRGRSFCFQNISGRLGLIRFARKVTNSLRGSGCAMVCVCVCEMSRVNGPRLMARSGGDAPRWQSKIAKLRPRRPPHQGRPRWHSKIANLLPRRSDQGRPHPSRRLYLILRQHRIHRIGFFFSRLRSVTTTAYKLCCRTGKCW